MGISNAIAWKYFFKRKNNHFINYISGLSILGLTIGLTALLLITSVFNGFEGLIMGMYSQTNADLSLQPQSGKSITLSEEQLYRLSQIEGITALAPIVKETVLFEYDNSNMVSTLYGVPDHYFDVVDLRPFRSMGELIFENEGAESLILGSNLKINLGVIINDPFKTIQTYFPNRDKNTFIGKKLLRKQSIQPVGTYQAYKDGTANTAYAPLNYVQTLVDYAPNEFSGIEFKLQSDQYESTVKTEILNLFPAGTINLLNKYEQDSDLYKLMNIEKWLGFALTVFTIILIAFNLIGCIWMIVIDKKDNFIILRAMGAQRRDIKRIVFKLGGMYALAAIVVGTGLTLAFYFLQKTVGLINLAEGFVVEEYPTELAAIDFLLAYLAIFLICLLAAWPSAERAANLAFGQKK